VSHPLEREREGEDAAAVDRGRDLARIDFGSRCDLGVQLPLQRVAGEPVAPTRPAAFATEQEKAGVLAGAVVLQPRRLRTALEVVFARAGLRKQ